MNCSEVAQLGHVTSDNMANVACPIFLYIFFHISYNPFVFVVDLQLKSMDQV